MPRLGTVTAGEGFVSPPYKGLTGGGPSGPRCRTLRGYVRRRYSLVYFGRGFDSLQVHQKKLTNIKENENQ